MIFPITMHYHHKEGPSLLAIVSDGYGKARLDGAKLLCLVKAKGNQEALKEAHHYGKLETTLSKGSIER